MARRPVTRGRPGSAGKGKVSAAAMRRWAEQNPLWKWRQKGKVSRPMAAAMFGVTNTAIWNWEHGGAIPTAENMDKLVRVLGPETVHQWVLWISRKPGWDKSETGGHGHGDGYRLGTDERTDPDSTGPPVPPG